MWLLILGAAALLYYIQYRRKISHLLQADEMYPGPLALPIIGNAFQVLSHRRDLVEYFTDLIWFYRRSLRVWINDQLLILLLEPHFVEKVIGSMEHNEKADQYKYLLDWIGRGLLTSKGAKWKKSRKILTPAFHFKILENFLEIFQRNGTTLIKKLEEKVGKNFDVYQLIKLYALDNICESAMGVTVNAQLNPNSDYVRSIKEMCEIVFTRFLSPWLWPDLIFRLSALGKRQKKSLSIIHGLTNKVIAQRKEQLKNSKPEEKDFETETGIKKRKVFMDILLQSSEEGGLTDVEIREEVDTFMFEGHDTVTSAISFALHCFSQNPKCQEKACEEIDAIFAGDDRAPTLEDLQNMKYLEMCIKETLRLYPSVPNFGRNVDQDIRLDERAIIPKGSQVVVMVQALHMSIIAWEKPLEFYPEHFELETAAKRHPYQYIPFSGGPRNCIGMRFAMLEMKSTLSRVLRNFKVLPASPDVPIKLNVDLILVSDTGVNIRLEKKQKRQK